MAKINDVGNIIWQRHFDFNGHTEIWAIGPHPNKATLTAVGFTGDEDIPRQSMGNYNILILQINKEDGTIENKKILNMKSNQFAYNFAWLNDELFVIGSQSRMPFGFFDYHQENSTLILGKLKRDLTVETVYQYKGGLAIWGFDITARKKSLAITGIYRWQDQKRNNFAAPLLMINNLGQVKSFYLLAQTNREYSFALTSKSNDVFFTATEQGASAKTSNDKAVFLGRWPR